MRGYSKIILTWSLCQLLGASSLAMAGERAYGLSKTQNFSQILVAQNDEAPDTQEVEDTQEDKALASPTNKSPEPQISYDLEALPFSTRRMHELILEATKAGDIEKLRPLIGKGEHATLLTFGDFDGDPVDFLKTLSGDDEGLEILAILEEVLEAGYVHLDKGAEQEMFVWPYFFSVPLDKLTKQQKVELFRIVTYGDYKEFQDFGNYIFYRVGITPKGKWVFFVAGD